MSTVIVRGTNLLSSVSSVAIVIPVNVVGVMGAGLAKTARNAFPGLFDAYRKMCLNGELTIDTVRLWTDPVSGRNIILFPTKIHWRASSKKEWIKANLPRMSELCQENGIDDVWVPKIGCGYGNLIWDEVRPMIVSALNKSPVKFTIVE